MTGSGSGAPGRDTTAGPASPKGFGRQILIVMAIGLIVRLIMAYAFPPLSGSGFKTDLDVFRYWANNLADQGPLGFYTRGFFADYTPGYLYALWLVGILGHLVGGIGDLIKLPPILTDVVLGLVVYRMARELGATERRSTLAGALVIVNPVTWFDSVVWGQVDSFGTVFLLLAIRELWKGRSERSAILAVVAALIKPQLAILIPILALVVIRRAVWPATAWGDEAAPGPSGMGWERRTTGWIRILTTALAGFVTAVLVSAPFGLSVVSLSTTAPFVDSALVRQILSTAATYSYVSVNAYNLWALFPVDGRSMASAGGWIADAPIKDAATWAQVAGIPAGLVGAILMVAVTLGVSIAVARRPDRLTILVGVCVLALAFFVVPTRVHERYLFPLFGLAAVLAAFSSRWRVAYVVATVATFLNMYVVLTTLYPGNPSISDWLGIGEVIRSWWGVAIIAIANTAVFGWAAVQLLPGRRRALAAELADGSSGEEPGEPSLAPTSGPWSGADPSRAPRPAAGAGAAATAAGFALGARTVATGGPAGVPAARRSPAWYERPSLAQLGPVDWLRGRMGETPIRPDRSPELAREGRGRLDRLDLWILIVIVVSALCLRGFRLAEPARMHFDEVYHARTATEFLQDWRYGISHSIYEWTHPHLAKYAMAAGIMLFAGHDVEATSQLDVNVLDAAIEPRRPDSLISSARVGDRVWVVTGSELIGYDLETRAVAARWSVPGASSVAFDVTGVQLFVGTDGGQVFVMDAAGLDSLRGASPSQPPVSPRPLASLGARVVRLASFDNGQDVAAQLPGDVVAIVDAATGTEAGRITVPGVSAMASIGNGDALTVVPANVKDPAAEASELASILGGSVASYSAALARTGSDSVVLGATLTADARTKLAASISAGTLAGVQIDKVPLLAVAGTSGVEMLTVNGTVASSVGMPRPAIGLALVSNVEDGTQLYVSTSDGATGKPEVAVVQVTGSQAANGPLQTTTIEMPGNVTRVTYDTASQMVEVLGTTPDGSGTTVYVIEPHGKAVFADQKLPFVPTAWVMDHNDAFPTTSTGQILAFASNGQTASLDVGHYDFAWRLPGVLLGALTAGALYLLTRVLFRRRVVGVLVGLFVLLDGMFFVQSRIGMNDVYTGFFIVAAYLLFAVLWLDPGRRWRWFWVGMPAIGLLLGLALASKWVAAYAIGALGILVLARSALGRLLLLLGLIGLTGVLGWMALAVPVGSQASGNLTFTLIMIGLTLGAVAVSVYHPIAWSDEEIRLAVGGPAAIGVLVAFSAIALGRASTAVVVGPLSVTPIVLGLALVVAGLGMYLAFQGAGRLGFGPMAPAGANLRTGIPPVSPPAEGWLRLGSGLGLPAVWTLVSLVAIPLVVYVISYLPWAAIEGHQVVPGWPPGHTGQTLLDLTAQMYRYHNDLTAAHPASSPWWAWPLDLKPVWFYQGGFASSTAGSIYDAGNVVIWWLGIPGMAFAAYQAFKRQSLPLALIVIGFLCQWISWARIDRAAFEYHYYTSLPFVVMGLAYLVAEIWHGASRRTWWMVRIAAAVALMGPVILWLLRYPLCAFANVDAVNKGSQACHGNPGNLVITPAAGATAVVAIVALAAVVRLLARLNRPRAGGRPLAPRDLVPLAVAAIVGGAMLELAARLPSSDPLVSLPGIVPELVALVVAVPLMLVAVQVATARDSRRFAVGVVAAAGAWFMILYPNISALQLPSSLVNAYQGLLPTYLYAFQFSVNTLDRNGPISFSDPRFLLLMAFLVIASAVVAYSAWIWRQALADAPRDPVPDAPPDARGDVTGPA